MNISAIIFFFIIAVYLTSLVLTILKMKIGGQFKKILKIVNLTALALNCILIILWVFSIHLNNLTLEIVPFWTFIISSIILFGLTALNKIEKIFYGIFFFGHLFLTVILVIPFVGLGITSMVYGHFYPDNILYEDKKVIVVDEVNGFLAQKPLPTVYIKCGVVSQKFHTNLSPVYLIDSVSLRKIDNDKIEIQIHGNNEHIIPDRKNKQTIDCNCF